MAALGKNIISDNPKEFSKEIYQYLDRQIKSLKEHEQT
jgi:hypothetical protein